MLLDQYGRPVRMQALTEPLARPGLTGIRQVWGGTTASGLTPHKLASILTACDQGDLVPYVTLAEEMEERDLHYASVLGTRKRAVSGVAPTVEAASDSARDKAIADAVRARIAEHAGFRDLVEDLLDGLGKGFSVVEVNWARSGREWWPDSFEHVDPRFIRFDRATLRVPHLLDDSAPVDGVPLTPFKFAFHTPRLKSGIPLRGGLARLVSFTWMCKAFALKDWVAFAELYGLPLRLGRYGPEATRDDVEKLFQAVANIGTDAAAVLPESMRIEFQAAATGAGGDKLFENLARYLDEQVSKGVLGQTMTSDNGSSQAQANVHNEVRHDIAAADAAAVTGTIMRDIVRAYVDLNFGVQDAYPRLSIPIAEPEDVAGRINAAGQAMRHGLRLSARELRTVLGFSDPEAGEEVVGGMPTPSNPPGNGLGLNRAELANAESDPLDEIAAEMLADWVPVMTEVLDPVEQAVANARSYDEALANLAALGPLPAARMIDALVKGTFLARAQGDVQDG
jgi:phage gp29-like protein